MWPSSAIRSRRAELARGINLAADFLDNPFSQPFQRVEHQIAQQQAMEVDLIKTAVHGLPVYRRLVPAASPALDRIAKVLLEKDREACDTSATAVTPVRHSIKIEAVK